ncbi:hypothetical protein [Streptacidiphilus sp. MAP12-16]|uniref:hypothetical protein n=1 Tax=Streptacidiphilus sp. MAP12-16 TaxID=3156300 RepID=UPI0035178E5A
MNGIEFMEQALDPFPGALRVLLTAYAYTNAALDAIDVVDLYLLEPWDSPEEKLYQVVDDLLESWRATHGREAGTTKAVGQVVVVLHDPGLCGVHTVRLALRRDRTGEGAKGSWIPPVRDRARTG